MTDAHVIDDVRRYEPLPDRINVYKEKWVWRESVRGVHEVVESNLIGHHVRVALADEADYFLHCNATTVERISTGPFIPRF